MASGVLGRLPRPPIRVFADRGSSAETFRRQVPCIVARPAILSKRGQESVTCPDCAYACRNRVERAERSALDGSGDDVRGHLTTAAS